VDALSTRVRAMPGVADVRYDRQWLNRLLAAVVVIRGVGVALAAILTFAAALTVANVVRLGLYTRRDELEIMQLVGAPQAYIRGPFLMEGLLQGGLAPGRPDPARRSAFALRARYLTPLASALASRRSNFRRSASVFCRAGDGGRVRGRSGRLVLQNLDSGFTPALHSILNNDTISRPCMPRFVTDSRRSARSTLSQSSTGRICQTPPLSSASAPLLLVSAITESRPRSRKSWLSSNSYPPKTTPRKSSAHSSENSTS
jgi:hypothetical protein